MKLNHIILFIFFASLIFRGYFTFTSNFADSSSYYHIRVVESMIENKKLFTYDELSYGGREIFGFPLFYFILLIFRLIFGSLGYKIFSLLVPNILIFVIYLLVREITKDKIAVVLGVLIA